MSRLLVAVLCTVLVADLHADTLERIRSVRPEFDVAAWRILNGGILLIGTNGEVRSWRTDDNGRLEKSPRGSLRLQDPRHTLLAIADLSGKDGPVQLLELNSSGVRAYALGRDGSFDKQGVTLARRARLRLRTNQPLFAEVLQDVNGDGRPDLIVPGNRTSELWIANGEGFRKAATVAVDIDRIDWRQTEKLSDSLSTSFRIPRLKFADVNGDGRSDLLVASGRTRAFHMQRDDGTLPPDPDVRVSLDIFRDTTPKAAVRAGKTLAGSDKARYESRDLDADGIPDYVIAHRRKVWVFHGNKDKPQFVDPTSILKVSDDVTAMMVTRLNDDEYPDLLIMRVNVPSVAGLLLGVLKSLEIEIFARGYASRKGRTFERTPEWRSEITLKVPSIVSMLKNPGKILSRFEEVGRKFRHQRSGDLNGDGAVETLLLSEDKTRIDVWRGEKDSAVDAGTVEMESEMRRMLFEDKNRTWDLDRILSFFAGLAERRTKELTGGRDPDATYKLRDASRFDYMDFALLGLPGNRKALVIRYLPTMSGARPIFDIVRLETG